MSYALRNTLILLVVLLLIVGGGWSYLYFVQEARITELDKTVTTKRQDLKQKQQIASQYPTLVENLENAKYYFNNYDKALYLDNNEDQVFDFINNINSGSAYTDFTFAFQDSTIEGEYGIITMKITGEGYYRNFNNFIRKIELSKPLNKTEQYTVTPINELEEYGKITYSFILKSYYDRSRIIENPTFDISSNTLASVYNPFYPMIQEDLKPNEDNLVNIEESDVIAISSDRVFLLDQNKYLKRLHLGDEVYLGNLETINLQNRSATFRLNKGGIVELVTLEVNNNDTDDDAK